MKTSLFKTLMAMLIIAVSCSAPKEQNAEESTGNEKPVAEISAKPVLLNPNLASVEELGALDALTPEQAQQIVDGRPYLNMLDFDAVISDEVENKEELFKVLFLPINLNIASEEECKLVPGVGDKMAHEFEEYRPYTSIEQFRREIGKYVSDDVVAEYEKYVFVPVNLNTASDQEILSIPGVGDKMLHEFKEYRPYESIEQFRREIGKYVDDNELARLERFVTL